MTRLDGGALNGRVRPIARCRGCDLISGAELCTDSAGHAMGASCTAVARDRHVDSVDFTGDASERLEHAVMCIRLRASVAGVIAIRVRDVHSPPRTAQDLGHCPGRRTMRMPPDCRVCAGCPDFRNESSTSDRNSQMPWRWRLPLFRADFCTSARGLRVAQEDDGGMRRHTPNTRLLK